jgi:diguanylate cyclase (GGDEF)-like protein
MAEPQELSRVVVVDDDRLTREYVRDALEPSFRVICCDSGEAAVAHLKHEPADLVISDLSMPGMSGLELLEWVRRNHPGTDFVLLTAHASVESAVRALRRGASDYLTKPVRPDELAGKIERLVAARRLVQENERLRTSVETLESCQTLLRCLDSGEVYSLALDLMLGASSRSRGVAVFQRPDIPHADGVAFRGFEEAEARGLRELLVGEKPIDSTWEQIEILDEGPLHDRMEAAGIASGPVLAIPLVGRDSPAGVAWILEDGRPFGEDEIDLCSVIAQHAGLALDNAERYSDAKERAFIDDVTEVYNARYLLQATEREIQRAERHGNDLCVLFLDLDHFKQVNDRHGHLVGSQTLRNLSEVLLQCIRQVDTLARYGGDEFTILLEDTGLDTGMQIAERIRRTVAETVFEGGRDTPIRVTISIGVAAYPLHRRDRDGLLDVADKAMYRAKSLGRNRVCSAAELEAAIERSE